MREKFNTNDKLISGYFHPYVYLNHDAVEKNNLDADEVSSNLAKELEKLNGIAFAVTTSDIIEGKVANTDLNNAVLRNYNPRRSGEIYIVMEPNWFVNDFDGLEVACTHGSPWTYDTSVPIIFAGNGIKHKKVYRKVETIDVSLTISNYIHIKIPNAASGHPLFEVLEKK